MPPGSLSRGRALVNGGGGKTVACNICHGDGNEGARQRAAARRPAPDLRGPPAPPVQGRRPERARRAADEEAGGGAHRRRHPEHLGLSRVAATDVEVAGESGRSGSQVGRQAGS